VTDFSWLSGPPEAATTPAGQWKQWKWCPWRSAMGDLEAALAQYEAGAVLQPWAGDPGGNTGAVADALIGLMDLRLPLSVWIRGWCRATALP
jgi:hypothetical protein